MTILIPLAVRLVTSRQDTRITQRLVDLTFRTVVPGGFASARFTMHGPLGIDPDEVAAFARVYVYDARTGLVVWEGRLEDPGRSVGNNGELYEVSALGPSTHASDRTVPLMYVDGDLSPWVRALQDISPGATADTRDDVAGSGKPALHLQLPTGLPVSNGSRAAMRYNRIWYAEQKLGRVDYVWDAGLTNANYSVRAVVRTDANPSVFDIARTQTTSTGGGGSSATEVVTDWPDGRNTLDLELVYTGSPANVGSDIAWASITDVVVQAMRYLADGTELVANYTTNTLLAEDIVGDLLGRLLPLYDGAGATIETGTYEIDQLTYPDGAHAEKILADLMTLETSFIWEALQSNSAGLHRFNWRAWPSTVRYEAIASRDGYSSTGSAAELYNSVRVRYLDAMGQIKTVQRTQTVDVLDDAGIIREGFIDLSNEAATTLAAAEAAGDAFLASHRYAPAAGRLTIARPIVDFLTGRMVMPWELQPGYLIRVRDLSPRPAVLDATERDGATTFKVMSVDYSVADAAAQLALDAAAPSIARQISDLITTQPRGGQFRRR